MKRRVPPNPRVNADAQTTALRLLVVRGLRAARWAS